MVLTGPGISGLTCPAVHTVPLVSSVPCSPTCLPLPCARGRREALAWVALLMTSLGNQAAVAVECSLSSVV